jgi:hypothetical protein
LQEDFSFSTLIRQQASDKTVILLGFNFGYQDMLLNMVCRFVQLGITNYVIAAFDDEAFSFCQKQVGHHQHHQHHHHHHHGHHHILAVTANDVTRQSLARSYQSGHALATRPKRQATPLHSSLTSFPHQQRHRSSRASR